MSKMGKTIIKIVLSLTAFQIEYPSNTMNQKKNKFYLVQIGFVRIW
ncbi:MAG: hypothetical protein ACTSQ4_08545 [Candidatus Heimdallarchaeaceae archaeon]